MAIKSLSDIPYQKRPSAKQQESAKRVKPKEITATVKKRQYGGKRSEVYLGSMPIDEVPSAVKSFRLKFKLPFQFTIHDEGYGGASKGRSYFSPARGSAAEAQAIKLAGKYKISGTVGLTMVVWDKSKGPKKSAKKPAKKSVKKPLKKAAKKTVKKPAKKAAKKTVK